MITQYSSLDNPFAPYDITLWVISTMLLFVFAIFTLYKIKFKQKEISSLQRTNAITWAIAFILLVVSNVLMLIWKYAIGDFFIAGIVDTTVVSLVNTAIVIKIIHIEYSINKYEFYKGYYFTVIVICLFAFTMIFTPSILREIGIFQIIYLILFLGGISIFPLMFLYLAIRLKGKESLMALRIVLGAACIGVGFVLQPQNIKSYHNIISNFELIMIIFTILCPILVILGTLLIFSTYKANL